ncbi:DnaB-like helicase C-terminal domain-containing protein [Kitasatospora sp. NPDC051164]|uniref:DnaB-like helicase C-terminal domain-containing protein n=1 Tax=Kitasatospora sp. NPDC051164 TaxID=3364055 RepID=UPI0037BC58C7
MSAAVAVAAGPVSAAGRAPDTASDASPDTVAVTAPAAGGAGVPDPAAGATGPTVGLPSPAAGAAPGPARSGPTPRGAVRGAGSSRRSGRPAIAPAAPDAVSEPGAAGYLNLPGPDDPLWASVPLGLRQNLGMPAYELVNPARGHLATPAGRKLKSALGAAARGKITGAHWLALLTAPRGAFGGPASQRAGQMYKALEQLVADHLRPALATVAAAGFAAGVELAQTAPAAPAVPAGPRPDAAVPGPAPATTTDPAASAAPAADPAPVSDTLPGPDEAPTGPDEAPTGPDEAPTGPDEAPTGPDEAPTGPDEAPTGPGAPAVPAPLRPVPASVSDATHPSPAASNPPLPNAVDAASADPAAAVVPGPAPAPATATLPAPAPASPDPDPDSTGRPAPVATAPAPVGDLAELLRATTQTPGTILALTSTHTATVQTALAQAQDLAPAHLPTVQVSGHDRASLARALYTRLGLGQRRALPGLDEAERLITAELQHTPRLVIATTTLGLRPSGLQLLHRLWEPEPFPLVLVGDTTLDGLLQRHDLAELHPRVTVHRVQEPAALAAEPAPAADPGPVAGPGQGQAATPGPAVVPPASAAAAAPEAAGPAAPVPPPGTAAPAGDLAAALREAAQRRSVLIVTSPDPAATSTALTHALDTGALQPLHLHGTGLDQVVPALFKHLGLGRRRPRTLDTAVVKITAELRRSPRLIVVPAAHELPEDALRWLGLLWASTAFPLVLGGDLHLDDVLGRPELTGLYPGATRHHQTAPAPAAGPAPATGTAADLTPASGRLTGVAEALGDTAHARGIMTLTGPGATVVLDTLAAVACGPDAAGLELAGLAVTGPHTVWIHPEQPTDRAALLRALHTRLGLDARGPRPRAVADHVALIAAELRRTSRPVIITRAHQLRTDALEQLYGVWTSTPFPLVLAGDQRLDQVLGRPRLEGLNSQVFLRYRLPAAPAAPAAAPGGTTGTAPTAAADAAPAAGPGPDPTGRHPAPAAPTVPAPAADETTGTPVPGAPTPPPEPAPNPQDTPVPTTPDAPTTGAAPAPAPAAPVPTPTPTPTPTAGPANAPAPAGPSAADPAAPAGEARAGGAASALRPATSPTGEAPTTPQTPTLDPASGPLPPTPALVLAPSPTTLHQARSTLPQMISAAGEGTSTPLTRGTHHALLTAPATATALGWDLTTATAHGTADARKKLGDLIQHAATGQPQVLRRHVTPLAVLLPAAPDGTPIPPAGTPDAAATNPPSNGVVTPHPDATPSTAAPVPPPAPAPETQPAPDRTTSTASTTHPSSGVEPDDTLFPTPTAPSGQPAPTPVEPNPAADAEPATSSSPAPAPAAAADEPALQDPAATTPPADQPATAAPAAPRAPRRLAPLADALTTVLTPPTPDPHTTPAGPRALSTGIPGLDDALGGLQPGRFYLAAAAPGTGGSLLATTTARTTALDHHLPVLYAASGLTRADVAARIVAAHLPVDYRRLRTGRLTPAEQADATTLHTELAAAHLYIDDGTDLTPDAIAETAADLAHTTTDQPDQPGLALVVVDRLQAADDPRLPLSGPRLTDAAQALAHLARTHHVPVLAILDTDQPDLITTLGLDTTLTLHPHPDAPTTQLLVTIAERDLGTQATLTLTADRTHARLTDPTPFNPHAHRPAPEAPNTPTAPEAPTTAPAPEAPTNPPTTAPEAPTQASTWPTIAVPGHPAQDTAAAPQPGPDAEVTPATAAALDTLANLTPDQPSAHPLRPAQAAAVRTAASRPARTGGGDYAGRDYAHYLDMINSVVDQTLQEHGGDTEAAITALEKLAIPNGMALFEATRVGGNYEHTVYPERLEFLSKKTRDGADDIWEGRHKWENGPLMAQLKAGTPDHVDVDVLDTNAAYCSALKTWLPIGALQHQPDGGFDPKRSGIYLLPKRPTWEHPHLPDPIGNRREPGPVLLDDATIRLLIRCHKLGLAEAPHITQAWTSGATENLAEKFRRVLTIAREKAILEGDDVTEKYIKAIYAKFVSTIGESSFNRDLRRPDWMHIFRSQAFANLWYKAQRAHEHGLTIVRLRGTDELHVTGDIPWRSVFTEGRLTTELKLKKQYTLPENWKSAA